VLISINHASLVIKFGKYNQTAFDELKFDPTIVTYLLFYIIKRREIESKKSADFTDFCTPISVCSVLI